MRRLKGFVLTLGMLAVAVTACGTQTGVPGPTDVPTELPEDVEMAVKEALSEELGLGADELAVVEAERREWPNACLGLPEEGEACAEVITPGWEVTLAAGGEAFVFRTDEDADIIRMER